MESGRLTHLVGSVPAPDGEQAMTQALDLLGDRLRWLPDGETGERLHWIVHIIDAMRQHPSLELRNDGDFSDYDSTPVFRVRRGSRLTAESLDFGHVGAFAESFPVFQGVRAAGHEGLRMQVGIPGDLDMTVFVLGPRGVVRHRRVFRDATVKEIQEVHERGRDDVVFQIEVPVELVAVAKAPAPLRPLVARMMARGIAKLAARAPAGAHFGIHLCLGDMNHKALANMSDVTPVVLLANAVAAHWPEGRTLEYVHLPLAAANEAPPTDPDYYAPLSRIRIPPEVRLIMGFVYEHAPSEQQRELLAVIETAAGRRVGVSAACGLGRRSPDEADASMRRTAELADA